MGEKEMGTKAITMVKKEVQLKTQQESVMTINIKYTVFPTA